MPIRYIIISLALHVVLLFSLNRLVVEQKPPKEDKPLIARILTKEIQPPKPVTETPTLPPKTKPQKSTVSKEPQKSKLPNEAQKQAAQSRPAVKTAPEHQLPMKTSPPREIEKGPEKLPSKTQPEKSAPSVFPLEENPPVTESRRQPTTADKLFSQDVMKGEARAYVYSHPSKSAARPKTGAHDDTEISFDVDDMKYHNYLVRLRDTIESVWSYPQQAGRQGLHGDLFIKFTINKDGTLAVVDVSRTSGHRILDESAMDALRRAFPFWPLPNEWGIDTFTITGHFIYTLQSSKLR
jgi:protein TonB